MEYKYPRVSEILAPYSNITLADVPKEYLDNACRRGTAIHTYAIAYAREDFLPHIEEEYLPYFDSFVQWYNKNVEALIFSEKRLYHDRLEFCGQPDLVVELKEGKGRCLIDLKSAAKIYQTYPIQLAAYRALLRIQDIQVDTQIILKLAKNGKIAKAYPYEHEVMAEYYELFAKAITLYNYFLKPTKKGGAK